MENKKRRGDWTSIVRLLKFMWQDYKWVLLVSAVLIVISALVTVNLTSSIRSLVDNFVQPMLQTGSSDFGPLRDFLLGLALFCLVGVIANYGFSIMMATISQDALRSLRNQLFERMQKLPVKYFDTHPHGDIMSIYTNDIDALRQAIEQSIPQLFSSAITMIGVTISMLVVSPLLFLVVAVMLAIMVWVIKTVSSKSGRYFGEQQKNLGIENGFIEEMMSGQKVIKAFVHEAASIEAFDQINEQLFQSSYLANRFSNVLMPILGNLGNVSFVLTSIAGGFMALNGVGGLTIGGLMSFLQLNRSFIGPITQVSQQLNFVLMASAGADRIFNLLDEEPEVNQGKVSLVNVEEVDVKLIDKDSLRKSLGIVLQDTHLFSGTIAENIAYGREDASREEILEAARIANVDSFVKHLDQGYETLLTDDGAGLSNGQRQLIAIARAALADAPVLILDEATSSIDSRTEKMVQEGLDRLMAGRTVFVIAHRLSTIVNSDVIMVMDHGRIIERGNHASLMAERGTYYRLYTGGLEID